MGFSDGESNFSINIAHSKDKTEIRRVKFEFRIALHIDDISVLEFIRDRLQAGNVRKFNGDTMAGKTLPALLRSEEEFTKDPVQLNNLRTKLPGTNLKI